MPRDTPSPDRRTQRRGASRGGGSDAGDAVRGHGAVAHAGRLRGTGGGARAEHRRGARSAATPGAAGDVDVDAEARERAQAAAQHRARPAWTTSRWTCSRRCAVRPPCNAQGRRTATRSSSTPCAACPGRACSPASTRTRPESGPTRLTRSTGSTPWAGTPRSPPTATRSGASRPGSRRPGTRRASWGSSSTSTPTSPAGRSRRCRPGGTSSTRCSRRRTTGGGSTAATSTMGSCASVRTPPLRSTPA